MTDPRSEPKKIYKFKPFSQLIDKLQTESGSFLLTMSIIAPLIFVFLALGFDISKFYGERNYLDKVAKQAVIMGSKQLPYKEAVVKSMVPYLSQNLGNLSEALQNNTPPLSFDLAKGKKLYNVSLHASNSSITLSIQGVQRSFMLSPFVGSKEIPISGAASAQVNPKDVVIFFDNSSYLAPDPFAPANQAWGSSKTASEKSLQTNDPQWAAAPLYKTILATKINVSSSEKLTNTLNSLFSRTLTQQCFNPAFSSQKEAAIRIYDYISSFPENSIGILMGPGPDPHRAIEVVRNISPVQPPEKDRGTFLYYRAQVKPRARIVKDEYCAAIASNMQKSKSGYLWPRRRDGSRFITDGSLVKPQNDFELSFTHARSLGPRQVIWSKAVHRDYELNSGDLTATPRYIDIGKVIRKVGKELLSSPYRADRGVYNHEIPAVGLILLGDFPWQNGIRYISDYTSEFPAVNTVVPNTMDTQFQDLNKAAASMDRILELYFIVTKHPGNYPPEHCMDPGDAVLLRTCEPFFIHSEKFQRFMKNQNRKWDNLKIYFLRVPDTASLATDFLTFFPLTNRTTTLGN